MLNSEPMPTPRQSPSPSQPGAIGSGGPCRLPFPDPFQRATGRARQLQRLAASLALAAAPLTGCSGASVARSEEPPATSPGAPATSQAASTDQNAGDGATAEGATPGVAPDNSSEPPAAGTYRGTYFVPVPDELSPYALFDVAAIRVELEAGVLRLRYDLPALLLGNTQGLAFSGTADADGSYVLEGDQGRATCSVESQAWTCDEVLHDVEPDTAKIERNLADLPAPEAEARRAVADRFAVDPIGVLRFDMAPAR